MKTERYSYIDLVRAVSIIGVMIIHTLSFHLSSPIALLFWNFLQFVVAAFVFCSGYVHAHYFDRLVSLKSVFKWYKKRTIRMLLPFYIYFIVHFLLFLIFPSVFTHFGMHPSVSFVIGSLLLYGGINTNWLPLLFLEMTLLTPILFFLYRRRAMKWYIGLASIFLIIHTIFLFPYSMYKLLMWIPWSLIFIVGLFSFVFKNTSYKKLFIFLSILSGILFLLLFPLWPHLSRSVNFSDNKYPPNLYYLSFALSGTGVLFLFSIKIVSFIPQWLYMYVSQKSYSLFFIHFIFLDLIMTLQQKYSLLTIPVELVLVIGSSIVMSLLLDKIMQILRYSSSAYTTSRVE
ncbi:MAG TPA: acyltransferase [Candidatus Saccharimonadales bacterium]|nr:acyltransferase [Candidatus Saccharimonadales bacterium]